MKLDLWCLENLSGVICIWIIDNVNRHTITLTTASEHCCYLVYTHIIRLVEYIFRAELFCGNKNTLQFLSFRNHEMAKQVFPYERQGSIHTKAIKTSRPRRDDRHFADEVFKCLNAGISIKISMKFVAQGPINKIPALVQIMAWRRLRIKPLSAAMLVRLLHICVTRPQWVNTMTVYYLAIQGASGSTVKSLI